MLLASLMDLASEAGGLPSAALAGVANATKIRALSRASDEAMSYLRARYTSPIRATVESVEYVPVTGSTGTGVIEAALTSGASITQALGIIVEVLTTGALGVATARVSVDSGIRWSASFTLASGDLALAVGVTLTISDPDGGGFVDGDLYRIPVAFGVLTGKVLALAVYDLMAGRGWDPDGQGGEALRLRHKAATTWLMGVRDNEIDPGLTDGNAEEEGGFFFYPSDPGEGDRGWTAVIGREQVSGTSAGFWDEV